jgi:hypothetical protein
MFLEKMAWQKFNAAYIAWDEIKMQREETIENFVSNYNGEIMELADGISEIADLPDSFSARLRISGKCLLDLVLNFAYIFEVSEVETIAMGETPENKDDFIEAVQIVPPAQSAPIVCIMDSGVQEEHKYLPPAISSNESISLLPNNMSTSDEVAGGGHGTRVAGAVLYPKTVPLDGVY